MTERREPYVVTPGAAAAQYRGCQQALSRTLRELADARAEIEALRAEIERARAGLADELIVRAKASLEAGRGPLTVISTGALSELERQIRQSERERCAYIAAGFGGTGCGATIANAIRERCEEEDGD